MMGEVSLKPLRALTWTEAASSDAALIEQCAAGNEDACRRLVTDYQRMVFQLGLNLLGDAQEAADLSQEVFLRVFRTLSQFRGQAALRTWIYRITINQAANRRRWWHRRRKDHEVTLDDHTRRHGDPPDAHRSRMPDQVLRQREVADRVWTAVGALPFDQRAVVVLREIDGLSYDEIGESLGIAVGTVKSRLARAREVLRASLREA